MLFFMNLNAQGVAQQQLNAMISIFTLIVIMSFVYFILKIIFDNKLKNKIINRGLPESSLDSFFKSDKTEEKKNEIKWILILSSCAIGFMIIYYTLPFGFHSISILLTSIAIGMISNLFFNRKS